MKKLLVMLLALTMVLSMSFAFAACGDSNGDESKADSNAASEATSEAESAADSSAADSSAADSVADSSAAESEAPAESSAAAEESSTAAPAESSEAPEESSAAPAESSEAPAESSEAPAEPSEAPTESSTEAPVESQAPVTPPASDDGNYAIGATYTSARDGTYDDTEDGRKQMYLSYEGGSTAYSDIDHTRLNDGVVTPGAELDAQGNGTDGKSVCFVGTDANFNVDFELAEAHDDITSIVFRCVRDGVANGNNRGFVVKMVQVSDDGTTWNRVKGEESGRVQVEGAPAISNQDKSAENVEHFDITYKLEAPASGKFVRIYFSNNGGYVAQFDEIEIRNS